MGIYDLSAAMIRNATNAVSLVMLHRNASHAHSARGLGIQRMYVANKLKQKKEEQPSNKIIEEKTPKKKMK